MRQTIWMNHASKETAHLLLAAVLNAAVLGCFLFLKKENLDLSSLHFPAYSHTAFIFNISAMR